MDLLLLPLTLLSVQLSVGLRLLIALLFMAVSLLHLLSGGLLFQLLLPSMLLLAIMMVQLPFPVLVSKVKSLNEFFGAVVLLLLLCAAREPPQPLCLPSHKPQTLSAIAHTIDPMPQALLSRPSRKFE